MATFLAIITLGFFLGMRHASDPDHVIAVTTIVARQRSVGYATIIGALWGLGHTLTILAVGAAIIVFGVVIPPRLGLALELSVGLMLILLGVLNLSGALRWLTKRFAPAHHHAREQSDSAWLDRARNDLGLYQLVRPVAVGIVHGLAGSAAIALLVLATIRNPWWAAGYLLVFGVGTIVGMMLITTALAAPFVLSSRRFSRLHRALAVASGAISVCFGLFICYHIGLVDGLFTSHPHWTPH